MLAIDKYNYPNINLYTAGPIYRHSIKSQILKIDTPVIAAHEMLKTTPIQKYFETKIVIYITRC